MKISPKQKLIAWTLGFVVVVILMGALLIVPQFGRMSDLDKQISQAETDYESSKSLLDRRQASKTRAHETETRALRLSNEIPESPELPSMIIELQDAVNESGLDFATLAPGGLTEEEEQLYQGVPVSMIVVGTWQDYVDLLQRLRRITRQIRIVGMSVRPADVEVAELGIDGKLPESGPFLIEAEIEIEAYTMETQKEAGGSAAPPPPPPG